VPQGHWYASNVTSEYALKYPASCVLTTVFGVDGYMFSDARRGQSRAARAAALQLTLKLCTCIMSCGWYGQLISSQKRLACVYRFGSAPSPRNFCPRDYCAQWRRAHH